jgi:membrane protein DedA with SNARE-associated domain
MFEQLTQINSLLDQIFAYGPVWVYGLLLVVCFVENIFPPFPGDSFIVAAGALVAAGRLSLIPSLACVILGGLGSVMVMYWLGRRFGRDYFVRKNFKYFSVQDIDRVERSFRKHGAWVLIFSRFAVGMRSVLAVVAGIGRYPGGRMLLYSAASYLLFAGLLMVAAIKLVENFDRLEYYFKTYERVAWPIVILIVVLLIVRKIMAVRRNRRL